MSRHALPSKQPGLTVTVGWDFPLWTFFAMVEEADTGRAEDDERDPMALWLGAKPGEISDPQEMVAPLAPYAKLPLSVLFQLRMEKAADEGREPTPMQRHMLHVIASLKARPG